MHTLETKNLNKTVIDFSFLHATCSVGIGVFAELSCCCKYIMYILMYSFYVTDGNIMYLTDASRFIISCVIQHYAPVVGWGGWRNRCIILIMSLDPSWSQTLNLPLTGIEPGSPAS